MRLTDLAIRKIKLHPKGQKIYYDDVLTGLGVRVGTSSKTFVVTYGIERKRKTIGRFPEISLSDARREARRILAYQNPQNFPVPYSEASESYLEECASRVRHNTLREYRRYLRSFDFKGNVGNITRQHLAPYLNQPHALTAFKIFFNWCIRNDLIDKNPILGERVTYNTSRSRILSRDELNSLWAYEYPPFSDLIKLLILTGQRRSEIGSLKAEWITDVITFPPEITKNKREHVIPYGELTEQYLQPFSWSGWSKAKTRLDKHVPLPHWTLHDIRRTFATIHAEIGTSVQVTEKLLNHVSGTHGGIVGVYQRHSYMAEMKSSVGIYEKHIEGFIHNL